MKTLKINVIVSTYNRPKALSLVLRSLCLQNDANYTITIADDGSQKETDLLVAKIQSKYEYLNIRHIKQEDKGFRLARIRNLAVKASGGEYLIFLDGDCVPPPNFISRHRMLMESGWAVCGQRILASQSFTREAEERLVDVLSDSFWRPHSMLLKQFNTKVNRAYPSLYIPLGILRKLQCRNFDRVRGCNWGMWRSDYERVNGSDENFEGWGSEDKDLAARLLNSGVKLKSGKFASFVLHLWHPIANREKAQKNYDEVMRRFNAGVIMPIKGMY